MPGGLFNNPMGNPYGGGPSGPPQPDPYASVGAGTPGALGSGGGPGKGGGIFGIGDENVQQQLAASGYRMYTPTAAPDVAGLFQTDQNPELQFRTGELGLMNTLQRQALGTGPSAAIGTLTAGRDQNVSNLMAAIAAGRGSPGTASGAFGAAATAGQTAANQAAIIRAQEQARAQSELGTVAASGAAGDLGEQQLRATQGAGLAGLETNDWQFGQQAALGQQGALNSTIAGAVGQANSSQQALLPTAMNALGGVADAAATGGASALMKHGTGYVADHGPEKAIIGDKGPEIVLPIHRNGTPDMGRATDQRLKWILEQHEANPYKVTGSRASGMPDALPSADHGILGQIVALRHDIQNLMRGR